MYRKIAIGLFSTFLVSSAFAQGIKFEKGSLQSLIDKAKTEKKLLFIDAMADWCGPCKLMDKNIFSKTEVGNFYNANFINAKFDMQKDAVGREIAQKFNVYSFPTFLFINGEGQLVVENKGYMDEKSFLQLGKEAANATTILAEVKDKFLKGDHSPEVLATVIRTYTQSDMELAKKASEIYFDKKKDATLSQEEVGFLLSFLRSTEDKHYTYFKKYRTEIEKYVNPQMLKNFDHQLQLVDIWKQSLNTEKKTVDDAKFMVLATPLFGEMMAKSLLNQYKLGYYETSGQFTEYEKIANELFANEEKINANEGLKAAWNIAEQSTEKKIIKAASVWVEKQVMGYETYYNTYVLSKLYHKLGKKAEAIMFAESAVRLAEQEGQDSSAMKQFLESLKK